MLKKRSIKHAGIVLFALISGNSLAQNVGINYDGSTPTLMLDIKTNGSTGNGLRINHTGSGDPIVNFQLSGTSAWTLGTDDSDLDEFKISQGGTLGTTNAFTINTSRQLLAGQNGTAALPSWSFETDENTGLWRPAADNLGVGAGGVEFMTLIEGATDVAIFNNNQVDADFRIAGVNQSNLFRVDAANDRIGIRNSGILYMLHMTNGGDAPGAAPMAYFANSATDGLAFSGHNLSTANSYNAIEGTTYGTNNSVAGVSLTTGTGGDGVTGSTNDWQRVGVLGTRTNSGGADTGFGGLFINDIGYTGGTYNVSDRKLKKDIKTMEGALDRVMQLRPVTYNFRLDEYPTLGLKEGMEYGFVAQEAAEIFPEIVATKQLDMKGAALKKAHDNTPKENVDVLMMDYSRIIPVLTSAMQEQQEMIETLKAELDELRKKVEDLENQ